jgi:long-chain acyl-CoA synthetase
VILPQILVENARLHGSRPAILDDERNFTWSEFADRVARAAGLLQDMGLAPGDRFALIMRNGFRNAELLWAGYWAGVVPVPINWRLNPREMAAILEDSGCKLIALAGEFLPLLDSPTLGMWTGRTLTVEALPGDAGQYEARIAAAAAVPVHPSSESDDAILLYTSGTTGSGKGVRLTHRNIISDAWQNGLALGIRPYDIYMHVAPMFHSADLNGTICFLLGCGHVYVAQFSPAGVFATIARHRPTVTNLVPTMVKMMAEDESATRFDLSSLRLIYYGSSPMPMEWLRAARERFPRADWYQGYGLTETSPILTVMDHECHMRCFESGDFTMLKSVGTPVAGVQMRIVDDGDRPLACGETGEVIVRGPNVSPGYYRRDAENAQAFRGGWFHTGDVGRLDENGFLFLVDRKKDVIITGGENVYSTEVEAALFRHSGVAEAAVIGVPDDKYGEALFAVIAPRAGVTLTVEDVVRHCREHIAGFKIPRHVVFVDALPRTALGKVQKNVLRQTYGAGGLRPAAPS